MLEDLDSLTRDGLHGIEQIVDLVQNLRNFSRLDRSKVASFNVNEGVRATLLIAKPALRKIDVERHLGDVPSITCSPSQVNQVLLNLVTNSAQAMDKPRGRIAVTTRRAGAGRGGDRGRGQRPRHRRRRAAAASSIRSTPPRKSARAPASAFPSPTRSSTQHGGRIEVRSTPAIGTVVTVTLPVDPPPELATLAESDADERAA